VDQSCNVIGTEADNRAASLGVNWNTSSDPCTDDENEIAVRFLNPDGSTPSVADDCYQADAVPGEPLGCLIEVTVSYQYNAATPIVSNLVGTLNLSGTTRQKIEYTNETP